MLRENHFTGLSPNCLNLPSKYSPHGTRLAKLACAKKSLCNLLEIFTQVEVISSSSNLSIFNTSLVTLSLLCSTYYRGGPVGIFQLMGFESLTNFQVVDERVIGERSLNPEGSLTQQYYIYTSGFPFNQSKASEPCSQIHAWGALKEVKP